MAARRPRTGPRRRDDGRRREAAFPPEALRAGLAWWSLVAAEWARYAGAVSDELRAASTGRMDPTAAMRRLCDLGRDHLQRLADLPRQAATADGRPDEPRRGRTRRQGRVVD